MHTPVLKDHVLQQLDLHEGSTVIDATFGEGGHTEAFLKQGATVLALDADQMQIDRYERVKTVNSKHETKHETKKLRLRQGNYADIAQIAREEKFVGVDAVLFDLGLSMNQLTMGAGFSYKFPDRPLDLVIDTQIKEAGARTASEIVAGSREAELERVFAHYGELTQARRLAQAIVAHRRQSPIKTVGDLLAAVEMVVQPRDFAAIFQALRIEVNDEYTRIIAGLDGATEIVRPGGKIGVITFHSGEDRLVKLWARKKGKRELARIKGRDVSEQSYEQSAVLRIYLN